MNKTTLVKEYYSKIQRKIPMNELEYENQKFIQIYIRGKPYLRFGGPLHERILAETLSAFRIPIIRNSENPYLIKTKTKNYELVGTGRAKKSDDSTYLLLKNVNDQSLFLGEMNIDKEHTKKISKLTGLEIVVLG